MVMIGEEYSGIERRGGEGRTGQDRTGQDRRRQDRTGQDRGETEETVIHISHVTPLTCSYFLLHRLYRFRDKV
jgi:hypothetical protein